MESTKYKSLNSKQILNSNFLNLKLFNYLNFVIWYCFGFRILKLEFSRAIARRVYVR